MSDKNFDSSLQNQKLKLRTQFKESLKKLTIEEVQQKSNRIVQHLQVFINKNPGKWACFRGLSLEPNLENLWNGSVQLQNVEWYFPRMNENQSLSFHSHCEWRQGSFGVWEPAEHCTSVKASDLQGILVPGVGFNVRGERLGHGKGYYDRALTSCLGIKLGVGFQRQVVNESLGCEEWDVPMNLLCTEDGVINCELK